MHALANLMIADVGISVNCREPILLHEDDPAYQSFLTPPGNHPITDVEIILEFTDPPFVENMKKIFDSEESWSMFKGNEDYYMIYKPATAVNPYWTSRMNSNFSRATAYCSDELVRDKSCRIAVSNPVRYPLDQIILMYYLSQRGGALIHAAGIEIDGKGYIFAGRSGAGKTTLSKQFVAKKYHKLLSDDRVAVRKIDEELRVFGTPWPGEGGIAVNRDISLAGIFFLSHGDSHRIERIGLRQALERMLPVMSIPWYDSIAIQNILPFSELLLSYVPAYILNFKPDTEVVDVLEKFVSK